VAGAGQAPLFVPAAEVIKMRRTRVVVLRDLAIFQLKLFLDGAKDIVLSPLAIGAAAADVFFPGRKPGHRFYAVLRLGERLDSWLNLYGAAANAEATTDGLFGASRAGSSTMLGRLEAMVLGHEEPETDPFRRNAA
jgi:hypothetical protein